MPPPPPDEASFATLGLSEPLLRALEDVGHIAPTPIQVSAIPAILNGRDVWGSARTGSGKTAAFVLPMLEAFATRSRRSLHPRPVRGLVVVPTRELAAQIGEAVERYGGRLDREHALKTCVVFGGVSINPQMMSLRGGADLVVATPGRLLDLVEQNALSLSSVEILVLDEADRLLSLGFADELARVLRLVPRCQTLLFSATFPATVRALAEEVLDEPLRIAIDAFAPLDEAQGAIVQRAIEVDAARRTMLLRHLLEAHAWEQVLVFVASRHAADHVADKLGRARITAAPFHGELAQGTRTKALDDFKAKRLRVLVATDVAARGLDITALPAVVNYDLPRSAVDYLHRIGRTGRAGEAGMAVSFVTADADAHFRLIEKRHHLRLDRERLTGFEPVDVAAPVQDPHGGVKGKRKSKKDKLREVPKRGT